MNPYVLIFLNQSSRRGRREGDGVRSFSRFHGGISGRSFGYFVFGVCLFDYTKVQVMLEIQ